LILKITSVTFWSPPETTPLLLKNSQALIGPSYSFLALLQQAISWWADRVRSYFPLVATHILSANASMVAKACGGSIIRELIYYFENNSYFNFNAVFLSKKLVYLPKNVSKLLDCELRASFYSEATVFLRQNAGECDRLICTWYLNWNRL